jgi:hypothetical protein
MTQFNLCVQLFVFQLIKFSLEIYYFFFICGSKFHARTAFLAQPYKIWSGLRGISAPFHWPSPPQVKSFFTLRTPSPYLYIERKTLRKSHSEESCLFLLAVSLELCGEIHFLKWPSRSCVLCCVGGAACCRFRFGTQVTRARQVNGVRAGSVRIFFLSPLALK